MADKVYFLDVEDWEQYGFTNTNIDVKKLRAVILRAQRRNIKPVIGSTLYDKIVADIIAGSLTGLYKELMDDYLVDTLVAWADYRLTFHNTNQIMNKATGKNSDEHLTANSLDDNNAYRNTLRNDAKAFERDMIGWLKDNKEDIPELCEVPQDKLHETLRPAKGDSDYFSNMGII